MTAHADVVTSIAAVARPEWNALCGDDLYSSHEWLSGVEEEVRADTRYVLVRSGGRLVAAMPLYRVHEEPNEFYRPHVHFGLPEARPPWWLAGSGRGYRNPLLVADDAPEARAALLAAVAEECGAPAWLLFLTEAARTALDGEDGISRAVPCLAAESVLTLAGHDFGDYLAGLSPTRRRTVGKEVRRFQRADLALAEEPPEENVDLVAGLVHRLNGKHGRDSDVAAHAAALRAQLRHLGDRARLFTCRFGDRVVGVTVGYVWHDWLYLWFAGFDYAAKPGAYEYFNLAIYEPVRHCYRTRLRGVHLGVGAHHAKAARGAQVRPLFARGSGRRRPPAGGVGVLARPGAARPARVHRTGLGRRAVGGGPVTPAPCVVIVDPYTTASGLAPRFSARGYHTVAVVTDDVPPDLYLSSYHPEYFDLVLPHTRNVAELVAGLRPFAPVAVLAGAETGVELADALADRVSPLLANPTRSSSARRHKGDMARRVAAAGLAHIRTISAASQDQVAGWLDRHGLHGRDLAVKPPRAGGANGLAICRAGRGWRDEFERVLREPDYYHNVNTEVIVQEWVRGTEYAVDTMSLHGRHVVTGICRYDKVVNAAHPAVYRAVEFVAPDGLDELVGYVRQVLDALEVRFGPAHTEVMVTEAGPVLIETGARLAGGGLAEVSAMATDIDPVELLVSLVDGGHLPDRDYRLVLPAVLRYVLVETGGTVRNAEVLGELKSLSSYYTMSTRLVTGERVAATTDLLASTRAGWVLLADTDATAVAADLTRADEVLSRLVID